MENKFTADPSGNWLVNYAVRLAFGELWSVYKSGGWVCVTDGDAVTITDPDGRSFTWHLGALSDIKAFKVKLLHVYQEYVDRHHIRPRR